MKRIAAIALVTCLIVCGVVHMGYTQQQQFNHPQETYRFKCVLFHVGGDRIVGLGEIDSHKFSEWFLEDYEVGGERTEIPKKARVCGALIFSKGGTIHCCPFYTWKEDTASYYVCQSYKIGRAPKFQVSGKSEDEFSKELLKALQSDVGAAIKKDA